MPQLEVIKKQIREIAGRPRNVTANEISKLVAHLAEHGFKVSSRNMGDHGLLFHVDNVMFSICTHPKGGGKQILPCYVNSFLKKMIELELYD